ncbi:MAG: AI-2E family transporter, partial [Bryobacterales bacterium]|nr:AI-2E family transporter [Bryobacterales bacterium]
MRDRLALAGVFRVELLTSTFSSRKPKFSAGGMIGLAAVIGLLYYGRLFFITVTIAVILAFILDPLVEAFMRLKMPRGLASFFTCSLALLVVYVAALAFYTQASGLLADLPAYSERINEIVDGTVARMEQTEQSMFSLIVPKRFQGGDRKAQVITSAPPPAAKGTARRRSAEPPPTTTQVQEVRLSQERESILDRLTPHFSAFYDVFLMASFVPFLVYFMLSWRDHMRRSFLQLFDGPDRMIAGKSWEGVADMARAYVVGNFILGLML